MPNEIQARLQDLTYLLTGKILILVSETMTGQPPEVDFAGLIGPLLAVKEIILHMSKDREPEEAIQKFQSQIDELLSHFGILKVSGELN